MIKLDMYVTRIECYGTKESPFREDQCVFSVEVVEENMHKVVLHEPFSSGEWPSVAKAIQRAMETIDKPLHTVKLSDDADEKLVIPISEVHYRGVHLKSSCMPPSGPYKLPVIREDNQYVCDYDPWGIYVFAENLDALSSEVNEALVFLWKVYALEEDEKLSWRAIKIKKRLLADWIPISTAASDSP